MHTLNNNTANWDFPSRGSYKWLDEVIAEQAEQKATMDKIAAPFTPAELCELVTEQEENLIRRQ